MLWDLSAKPKTSALSAKLKSSAWSSQHQVLLKKKKKFSQHEVLLNAPNSNTLSPQPSALHSNKTALHSDKTALHSDRRIPPPRGGGIQNPRSRNLGPQNKGTPTQFVPFWGGGTLILRTQIPRTRVLDTPPPWGGILLSHWGGYPAINSNKTALHSNKLRHSNTKGSPFRMCSLTIECVLSP